MYVMDETGVRLASRRLPEGLEGIRGFHELVADLVDDPDEVVVGIETDPGLWVHALTAAGYQVMPSTRWRYPATETATAWREQSRMPAMPRCWPAWSAPIGITIGPSPETLPEAEAVTVLAQAHQNLIWARTRHTNQLRNALRKYYPAALEAFDDRDDRDTLAVLERAPDPTLGARLTVAPIRAVLKRAGPSTQPRFSSPRNPGCASF